MGVATDAPARAAVLSRTEGWMAGLRLLSMTLSDAGEASADSDQLVSEYLCDELLAPLPAAARELLLRTCLTETVPAELAEELTGDPAAAAGIDQLSRENGLIHPTGAGAGEYRYHPMLRERPGDGAAPGVRRRGAAVARRHRPLARAARRLSWPRCARRRRRVTGTSGCRCCARPVRWCRPRTAGSRWRRCWPRSRPICAAPIRRWRARWPRPGSGRQTRTARCRTWTVPAARSKVRTRAGAALWLAALQVMRSYRRDRPT